MSKDKYVCNLHATEKAGERRTRVLRLMVLADSYTEVEALGFKYYEDHLKKEYENPVIADIKVEKSNKEVCLLTDDEISDGLVEYATVFKTKASISFGEESKRYGKMVLVRANSIEDVITKTSKELLDEYAATDVEILAVQATNLAPESPIFDSAKATEGY